MRITTKKSNETIAIPTVELERYVRGEKTLDEVTAPYKEKVFTSSLSRVICKREGDTLLYLSSRQFWETLPQIAIYLVGPVIGEKNERTFTLFELPLQNFLCAVDRGEHIGPIYVGADRASSSLELGENGEPIPYFKKHEEELFLDEENKEVGELFFSFSREKAQDKLRDFQKSRAAVEAERNDRYARIKMEEAGRLAEIQQYQNLLNRLSGYAKPKDVNEIQKLNMYLEALK